MYKDGGSTEYHGLGYKINIYVTIMEEDVCKNTYLWGDKMYGELLIKGNKTPYIKIGKGSKNIILLPGLGDGNGPVSRKQDLILRWYYKSFLKDFTVYIISRPDYKTPQTIYSIADDMSLVIKELALSKVFVLGISMGGLIAQQVAVRHPTIVDKICIGVSAGKINENTKGIIEKWKEYVSKDCYKDYVMDTIEKTYTGKKLKFYRKFKPFSKFIVNVKEKHRFYIQADACKEYDGMDTLKNIKCEVLLINGDQDKLFPKDVILETEMNIPNCTNIYCNGSGHGAFEEQKKLFDKTVYDFFMRDCVGS